ncbi:MAG TPA: hypothetical protein VFQ61_18105 [Polyangiaceae bacterium]|nr:hypothetical protein [Polyangiaceae bacterium]
MFSGQSSRVAAQFCTAFATLAFSALASAQTTGAFPSAEPAPSPAPENERIAPTRKVDPRQRPGAANSEGQRGAPAAAPSPSVESNRSSSGAASPKREVVPGSLPADPALLDVDDAGPSAQRALPRRSARLGLPPLLPYRSGLPVPRGYHVEYRPATGLILSGALALGVGYATAIGIGMNRDFEGSLGWLAVPVLGPWPALAGRKLSCAATTVDEARGCLDRAYEEATTIALVAVDGMLQATGALLLIAGLASGRSELVRSADRSTVSFSIRRRPEGGVQLGVLGAF